MSARAWWTALKRTWTEAGKDNISLIAAGTAFYAFAAIVPLLASVVLIYGLVADTATVVANIRGLFAVLPDDAARVIGDQLTTVVGTSEGKKGFGLVIALGIALYGGTKGASSIVTAPRALMAKPSSAAESSNWSACSPARSSTISTAWSPVTMRINSSPLTSLNSIM